MQSCRNILFLLGIFVLESTGFAAGSNAGSKFGKDGMTHNSAVDFVKRKWFNVAYANRSRSQRMDIYLPNKGKGPFPVIVAVHGGAFVSGDKADGEQMPMLQGLERGYAVVSVNYRLSGEAKFPKPVHDIKAAIRWIRANARAYNFNGNKIALWGGSAGGNLSALAGTTSGVRGLDDPSLGNAGQSSRVQAVVDWYGPTNFLEIDRQLKKNGFNRLYHSGANSPESKFLGRKLSEVPWLVKAANPETYITPDDPPFLIQHGTKDPVVPVDQSVHFKSELEKRLGKNRVAFDLIKGAAHGGREFAAPENIKKVLDFLDRHMK